MLAQRDGLSRGRVLMMVFTGTPPFREDELEPLMPQKVGDSMSLWSKVRAGILLLSRAFRLYAVRAAVVDPRTTAVSHFDI